MPRMIKDENFDMFISYIEHVSDPTEWLNGKTTKEVYEMYVKLFRGTLPRKSFTTRVNKIYGQWLDCPMTNHERRWVRK